MTRPNPARALSILLTCACTLNPVLSIAQPSLQTLTFIQEIDELTKLIKRPKARVLLNPDPPNYLNARKSLYRNDKTRFYLEFSEDEAVLKIHLKIR